MPEVVCPTAETLDATPWLAELKSSITNCTCEISIIQATYKGKTVFYKGMTDALCNGIDIPTLYNCSGNVVKSFTDSAADQEDLKNISIVEVLYRCQK
jgi:hypothetical protein